MMVWNTWMLTNKTKQNKNDLPNQKNGINKSWSWSMLFVWNLYKYLKISITLIPIIL